MDLWIVLPAYNEAENIPRLLDEVRGMAATASGIGVRVVVVDDGSTDGTSDAARAGGVGLDTRLLRNPRNLGLAGALRVGLLEATSQCRPDDAIVTMDADNTHLPSQALDMAERLRRGADVVIGSRFRFGAEVRGVPWGRRLLSRCMSLLFRLVYPIAGVRDYSSGYRAYNAGFLQDAVRRGSGALFAQEGFECMAAILIRLHKAGARFDEVPLILRYDRKRGRSKMRVFRTVRRSLSLLIRERFSAD